MGSSKQTQNTSHVDAETIGNAIGRFRARTDNVSMMSYCVGSKTATIEHALELVADALTQKQKAELYFHIPVCEKKCGFCHYNSEPQGRHAEETSAEYAQLLMGESETFAQRVPQIKEIPLNALYFGGGTPNLMPIPTMEELFDHIRARFTVTEETEVTMEGRPETWTKEKINAARKMGVNRASMGIQSLDEDILKAIRRHHTGAEAREAVKRLVGEFPNINTDLMYGLPGTTTQTRQTIDKFVGEVEELIGMGVPSITLYRLRIDPRQTEGSPLASVRRLFENSPELYPDIGETYEMNMNARAFLLSRGFVESPIGLFAKKGSRPKFYWGRWVEGFPLIGFGLGAYSYTEKVFMKNLGEHHDEIEQYMEAIRRGTIPFGTMKESTDEEFAARQLVLGLKGALEFDVSQMDLDRRDFFGTRVGIAVKKLIDEGFLAFDGKAITFTSMGLLFSEEILGEIWKSAQNAR